VLLKITYLLMRWTFGLAVLMLRGDPDLRKLVMIKATTCGNAIEAFAETC
jgi:hypothetical protein